MRVRSFSETDSYSFFEQLHLRLKSEIEHKGKEYILCVDENDYKKYLSETFKLTPLNVDASSEFIAPPRRSKENKNGMWGEGNELEVYFFTIEYKFTGSADLFRVQPNTWAPISNDISIDTIKNSVSFDFKLYKQDAEEFKRAKNNAFARSFTNLENVNKDVLVWNNALESLVNAEFNRTKNKFQSENDFFTAINVNVNPNTTSIFSVPTIQKKPIPQPTVKRKEFSSEPMMSREMYDDLLKVVYDSGKSMEKKPALYKDKEEEDLRAQFLFVLETRYEATTATGETFNKDGKTDIILKHAADGSNLFVAECKFWYGLVEFHKAISQLFDRYLTWRDSKAALLIFVSNKDFSNVVSTVQDKVKEHPYFKEFTGKRGETSFSYLFGLPQDMNKDVHFEIMLFHYVK